ncbi:translation termination factor GTPase eRF3, partial [Irineochytrium annulatum]
MSNAPTSWEDENNGGGAGSGGRGAGAAGSGGNQGAYNAMNQQFARTNISGGQQQGSQQGYNYNANEFVPSAGANEFVPSWGGQQQQNYYGQQQQGGYYQGGGGAGRGGYQQQQGYGGYQQGGYNQQGYAQQGYGQQGYGGYQQQGGYNQSYNQGYQGQQGYGRGGYQQGGYNNQYQQPQQQQQQQAYVAPQQGGPRAYQAPNAGGSQAPAKTIALGGGAPKAKAISLGSGGGTATKITLGASGASAPTPVKAAEKEAPAAKKAEKEAPAAKKAEKETPAAKKADQTASPALAAAKLDSPNRTPAKPESPAPSPSIPPAEKVKEKKAAAPAAAASPAKEAMKESPAKEVKEGKEAAPAPPIIEDDDEPIEFEKDEGKEHLNIVFIGHVDAGKSTMGGHLLFLTGMVDKRTLEKYEKEAKEQGRESWYLSWALDLNQEERAKGKTVEYGRAFFETDKRRFTIIDAPGHKNFVPSMMQGAAQADVGILVISARKGEFETGFEKGGQTREHAMLAKTVGVKRLIVVVNKMDDPTVMWDKARYDECTSKILPFLKQVGYNPKTDIDMMPVSGFTGANLKDRLTADVCDFYDGPSLLELLDYLTITDRNANGPLIMPISDKFKDMGTVVTGKIESGRVRKGQTVIIMPNKKYAEVMAIYLEDLEKDSAKCGDNVRIRLKNVEEEDVLAGFVMCTPKRPVHAVTAFEARLAIVEYKSIMCAGYQAVCHAHTNVDEVTITALLHKIDKKTGKRSKNPPQFIKQGDSCIARIETSAPICLEKYDDLAQLGRFTLRDEGKTVAIGRVTKLIISEEHWGRQDREWERGTMPPVELNAPPGDGRTCMQPAGEELVPTLRPGATGMRWEFWFSLQDSRTEAIWRRKLGAFQATLVEAFSPQAGKLVKFVNGKEVTLQELAAAQGVEPIDLYKSYVGKVTSHPYEAVLRKLPEGYEMFSFSFEPKDCRIEREENASVSAPNNKPKLTAFNGVTYRTDPYMCGHPGFSKFRSSNEFLPHLMWLYFCYKMCPGNPVNEEQWKLRDYKDCSCLYCFKYISHFSNHFYLRLTRPRTGLGKRDFHAPSPPPCFRRGEKVWARVVITTEGDIEAATAVYTTLLADMVSIPLPTNPDVSGKGKVVYWPAEIESRKVEDDKIMRQILKTHFENQRKQQSRKRIGGNPDTMPPPQQNTVPEKAAAPVDPDMEDPGAQKPFTVLYRVRLLGTEGDGPNKGRVLLDVETGSLQPFLQRKGPFPGTPLLPDGLDGADCVKITSEYKEGIASINGSAKQVRPSQDHKSALMFGNEVIRVGDLVRLRPAQGSVLERAFEIRAFTFLKEGRIRLSGVRWERDERFAISMHLYHTRVMKWDPMESEKAPLAEVEVTEVAGRFYPIIQDGLKVGSYGAAMYWQDWHNTMDHNSAMPIKRQDYYSAGDTVVTNTDDGDVVRATDGSIKKRLEGAPVRRTTIGPGTLPTELLPAKRKRHSEPVMKPRNRKPLGVRKQSAKITAAPESSSADEATRCICASDANFGDMILCDQCNKWQHTACMNVQLSDYPDGVPYFCEDCDPDNHPYYRDRRHSDLTGRQATSESRSVSSGLVVESLSDRERDANWNGGSSLKRRRLPTENVLLGKHHMDDKGLASLPGPAAPVQASAASFSSIEAPSEVSANGGLPTIKFSPKRPREEASAASWPPVTRASSTGKNTFAQILREKDPTKLAEEVAEELPLKRTKATEPEPRAKQPSTVLSISAVPPAAPQSRINALKTPRNMPLALSQQSLPLFSPDIANSKLPPALPPMAANAGSSSILTSTHAIPTIPLVVAGAESSPNVTATSCTFPSATGAQANLQPSTSTPPPSTIPLSAAGVGPPSRTAPSTQPPALPPSPFGAGPSSSAPAPPPSGPFTCGLEGCTRVYMEVEKLRAHQRHKVLSCNFPGCTKTFHRALTHITHQNSHTASSATTGATKVSGTAAKGQGASTSLRGASSQDRGGSGMAGSMSPLLPSIFGLPANQVTVADGGAGSEDGLAKTMLKRAAGIQGAANGPAGARDRAGSQRVGTELLALSANRQNAKRQGDEGEGKEDEEKGIGDESKLEDEVERMNEKRRKDQAVRTVNEAKRKDEETKAKLEEKRRLKGDEEKQKVMVKEEAKVRGGSGEPGPNKVVEEIWPLMRSEEVSDGDVDVAAAREGGVENVASAIADKPFTTSVAVTTITTSLANTEGVAVVSSEITTARSTDGFLQMPMEISTAPVTGLTVSCEARLEVETPAITADAISDAKLLITRVRAGATTETSAVLGWESVALTRCVQPEARDYVVISEEELDLGGFELD